MKEKVITEEYIRSLSEEELLEEQKTWTVTQWQQYLCPNGTISFEEFKELGHRIIDEEYNKLGW